MSRRTASTTTATVAASSENSAARISIVPPPNPSAPATPAVAPSWDPSSPVTVWLPAALALALREISPCRASISRVAQNLTAGADALLAVRDEIDREGISVDWDLVTASSSLGLSLSLVSARVPTREPTLLDARRAMTPMRRLLASDASTLTLKRVFPESEVRRLLRDVTDAGRAHAVIGLVDLYRVHAAEIAGRTMITAADLTAATAAAEDLLGWVGRGKRVRAARSAAMRERIELRDRFWTLAQKHHAMLCRVGGAYWGRKVTAHIPGLQSARIVRRAAPTPPPPAPV